MGRSKPCGLLDRDPTAHDDRAFERRGREWERREPHDQDPTADVARARWKARAEASWLSQVKWLEPEVGSNPRNSADQFEFEFKS